MNCTQFGDIERLMILKVGAPIAVSTHIPLSEYSALVFDISWVICNLSHDLYIRGRFTTLVEKTTIPLLTYQVYWSRQIALLLRRRFEVEMLAKLSKVFP
jgi:hypothetical protein